MVVPVFLLKSSKVALTPNPKKPPIPYTFPLLDVELVALIPALKPTSPDIDHASLGPENVFAVILFIVPLKYSA